MTMRSSLYVLASLALLSAAGGTGCSRSSIEAVNLSNEGDRELKASNVDGAISKYEQATGLDPLNHRIFYKLARAYQKKEAWDRMASALQNAQRAATDNGKQKPTHADYYFLQGYALEQLAARDPGKWGEAKAPLQQAAQLDANYAEPHFELGEVHLHLDDEQTALQEYTKAIDLKPTESDFYGPLAQLYLNLNFLEQAEKVVAEGLRLAVGGPEAPKARFQLHTLLGAVREAKGDMSGTISEFQAAKEGCGQCNEKGQQIAYFNLGYAYTRSNPPRKREAVEQLRNFHKIVCITAAKKTFGDQCSQTQDLVKGLGESL